ncbi:hypothetical protein GCM10007901_36530 [Dyella acidisoli]|uniref:Uncharacterized protein n=1 Tax=Dyella acidisoli TaxID=1867834 RepID=A0ABQ5XW24_9GAMM|nr:hypothetical protein GCM10007901_36530 [Dyella acidisoli]
MLERGQVGIDGMRLCEEGIAVFLELLSIRAAQQQIFPLLHLFLEIDLRNASGIDRRSKLCRSFGGTNLQIMGADEPAPAAETDDNRGCQHHDAKQAETGGDGEITKPKTHGKTA